MSEILPTEDVTEFLRQPEVVNTKLEVFFVSSQAFRLSSSMGRGNSLHSTTSIPSLSYCWSNVENSRGFEFEG